MAVVPKSFSGYTTSKIIVTKRREERYKSVQVESITLSGTLVRLEPLQAKHATDLYEAGQDERIWRYMPVKLGQSVTEMQNWIASTLKLQESGTILPFAIIDKGNERAIGSTRYLDIQEQNR